MKQNSPKGFLKISELASAADISLSTVKYYVREGLVEIALKTGRNMAYYAPESVERVKLIRAMQSEKYYPLSVIKRIIQGSGADAGEVLLLDTINKAGSGDYYESTELASAVSEAGLKPREGEALVRAGLVAVTKKGRVRYCGRGDVQVMGLAKARMEAGIPLSQTIKTFQMYQTSLEASTKKDIASLVKDAMLQKTLSTDAIVHMINVSDETLDSFISMKRYAMNAAEGAAYISKIEAMLAVLLKYGSGICKILKAQGAAEMAMELERAMESGKHSDLVLAKFCTLLQLSEIGIARSLWQLHSVSVYLSRQLELSKDPELQMTKEALKLGFMFFMPEELGYDKQEALENFRRDCRQKEFMQSVLLLLEQVQSENK